MWNIAITAAVGLAEQFLRDQPTFTTVKAAASAGAAIYDMVAELIGDAPEDAPAEELRKANEALQALQAIRDQRLEELRQKAPNS